MAIIKFLISLKQSLFNRSSTPVPDPPEKRPTELPKYFAHLGVDIRDTLEAVTKFNRSLVNKTIPEDIPVKRVSTIEWRTVESTEVDDYWNTIGLLKESLESAMQRIDDTSQIHYYRTNRLVLDAMYPKLHNELKFVRVLESLLR